MVDPIWLEILGISEDEMKKTKTVKYEGKTMTREGTRVLCRNPLV